MGIVAIPVTFADGPVLTAADLNSVVTGIYNEFNGNIDDANIKATANIDASKLLNASIATAKLIDAVITEAKLDYTSLKVLRVGPNFGGGTNGKRAATGGKAFTYAAGLVSITITFSTDSDDGNPAFAAAPRLVGIIEHTGGVAQHTWRILSKLASSVTIEIRSSNGADVSSGTFTWHAIGDI